MRHVVESSWLCRLWDLLIIVCTTWAAVEFPLRIVLRYYVHPLLWTLDWVITCVMLADLFLRWQRPGWPAGQFVSSPVPEKFAGKTLLAAPPAAFLYQKGWFFLDLFAALPFGILPRGTIFHLLILVKLARVAQLMRQWRHSAIDYANFLRLGFFAFWLLLTAHWLGCGWLALRGMHLDEDRLTQYIRALYWCITTLATVGYGDITPANNQQMVYAMVVMLLGVGVYGYVIGNVTSLLANIDLAKNHYRETMERLTAFMRYRNLPPPLQRRIRDYYAYLWEKRLGYDESMVLAELPDNLRVEVALFLRRDIIERVDLFQGASHELIRELALELRPVIFTPGDYVCHAREFGRHMYFISLGTVEVIIDNTVVNTLNDGEFFGEIALLFSEPRTASVRALTYCDLYVLDKDTFDHILSRYPGFSNHIHDMATLRKEHNEGINTKADATPRQQGNGQP